MEHALYIPSQSELIDMMRESSASTESDLVAYVMKKLRGRINPAVVREAAKAYISQIKNADSNFVYVGPTIWKM